ncbi:MAG: dihydroorotase [Treponema sp.]|nr:dihydroorotase [Treponema sp.]
MSDSSILVIYNAVLVDSKLNTPGAVVVEDGKIRAVLLGECKTAKNALHYASAFLSDSSSDSQPQFYDAKGLTLMPSFVDMHVHFRYPGQTQKEDLDSGLRAAVAGGYGTVVLMPNTNPVVSEKTLAKKIMDEAKSKNLARVFQTVSVTKNFEGTDTNEISKLSANEFPVISEDGRDVASSAVMLEGMKKAAEKNIIVSCHCEDPSLAQAARPYRERALGFMAHYGIPAGKVNVETPNVPKAINFEIDGNLTKANSLLALAEDTATIRNIEIAKMAGCHVHICHCSTKTSMDAVRRAKEDIALGNTNDGFECTVEVTPHHLALVGTDAPNIRALVNPPLRSDDDRRSIIEALRDGTVDAIATDHAPHTQEDKAKGSPGFSGIETAFAVCNTILVKKEGFSLSKLSRLMSENPARLLRIESGRIKTGYNADLVLVNPDEEWIVNSETFRSKGKSTPFEGKRLTGKVHATFFGGKQVF